MARFVRSGSLASRVEYDEEGQIKSFTPSNFVTGRGTIDGRPVIIGCDDFTVRGGAADGAIGNKMGWSETDRARAAARQSSASSMAPAAAAASGRTPRFARSYVPANPDWDVSVAPAVAGASRRCGARARRRALERRASPRRTSR